MCEDAIREGSKNQPTIESLQRDIELGNRFRLELSKILLASAAALLAFTISFPPSLVRVDHVWLLGAAWLGLASSMSGGFLNMYGWERYYLSYRDFDWRGQRDEGMRARKVITRWRRCGRLFQGVGFLFGVIGIAIFTTVNLPNLKFAAP
jgi:hypothetical protein